MNTLRLNPTQTETLAKFLALGQSPRLNFDFDAIMASYAKSVGAGFYPTTWVMSDYVAEELWYHMYEAHSGDRDVENIGGWKAIDSIIGLVAELPAVKEAHKRG